MYALAAYVLLTLVQGRFVVRHASDSLASDAGDPVLNATILTWTSTHVPLTDGWWNFPGFHPLTGALTFSEHLTGLTVLAAPLIAISGQPILTYNVLFLLSFVATAMTAYALAFELTRRADAAFLAGLIFGFAPYRVAHLSHLQMLSAYWTPLALLAMHRHVATGRVSWAAAAAAAWLMQGLTNSYAVVHVSVVVGMWTVWFVVFRRRWRSLAVLTAAFGAAALLTVPLISRYLATHEALGLRRDITETTSFSADVLSFLHATSRLSIWGWVQFFDRPEGELFPGVGLPILIAVCAAVWWRAAPVAPDRQSWPALRPLLMAGAAAALAAAVSVWVLGPWAIQIGPLRMSSSAVHKPVSVALVLLLLAGATSRVWRSAMRTSSDLAFYAGAALVTWLLALGPAPTLAGTPILYRAPYEWLLHVPGVDQIRVPARFWLVSVLCLAMVTAILFTRVTAALAVRRRLLLAALASAALIADGWTTVPVVAAPQQVDVLAEHAPGFTVLELPLGDLVADAAAQYRAAIGGWRSFNGYSGYSPPHYQALRHASESSPIETLDLLRRYGPLLVSVDTARDGDGRWAAAVAAHPAAEPVAGGHGMRLFQFDPQPPGTRDVIERPLRIATITASCGADAAALIRDGNIATAWECGVGASPLQLVVELDAESTLAAITERSGRRPTDPTARLAVQTSIDGESWDDAWEGSIALPALAGSLSDPLQNPVTVRFDGRRARFVRLRHTGATADYRWWIAELVITGTP